MSLTLTTQQAKDMFGKLEATMVGSKHIIAELRVNNKHVFRIPISHGSKEIPTGTAHKIFKQAHLKTLQECYDLRNCPMSKDMYIALLASRNLLT